MWIKADDKLAHHPKILRAGKLIGGKNGALLALGFFHWCISYSAEYLTDGFLADEVIEGCALCEGPSRLAKCLSEAKVKAEGNGLLIRVDGGYRLNDYHDWNPTAEEARELIEAKRVAGRSGGLRSGESRKQKAKQNPSSCLPSASEADEAEGQANGKQKSSSRARDPVPSCTDLPPSPPHEGGADTPQLKRITRGERKRAEELRRAWGRCLHTPECQNHESCLAEIVRGWREKTTEVFAQPTDEDVTEKDLDAARLGRGS